MNETPKEARKLVADALRRGRFKQGRYCLHNIIDDTYCCLGVACKVYMENGGALTLAHVDEEEREHGDLSYDGHSMNLPVKVQDWLGMSEDGLYGIGISLIEDNDERYKTFNEIANTFETESFEDFV